MNQNIFFAAFFFPAVAAVLVFFMKYVSEILQARVRLGRPVRLWPRVQPGPLVRLGPQVRSAP